MSIVLQVSSYYILRLVPLQTLILLADMFDMAILRHYSIVDLDMNLISPKVYLPQ